jgi:hypothetical protein
MKTFLLLMISFTCLFCSTQKEKLSKGKNIPALVYEQAKEKEALTHKPCHYESEGSIDSLITIIEVVELRIAKAKEYCKSLNGTDFVKTKINALDRLRPNGDKYIIWTESVFCNCDE